MSDTRDNADKVANLGGVMGGLFTELYQKDVDGRRQSIVARPIAFENPILA